MTTSILSVVIWNIEFGRRRSARGRELLARIEACDPDLVCITEGHPDFLELPHLATAGPDYGYPNSDGRRKVLLWSREPWRDVDAVGDEELPPGRYAAATTASPIGEIRVHGVCIPWAHAHVSTGRRDRRPWDEHRQYLGGLSRILRTAPADRILVLGDYNQRLPRRHTPEQIHAELTDAFPSHLGCATQGLIESVNDSSIDHLHHSADLEVVSLRGLSNLDSTGRALSDHFGLHLVLCSR